MKGLEHSAVSMMERRTCLRVGCDAGDENVDPAAATVIYDCSDSVGKLVLHCFVCLLHCGGGSIRQAHSHLAQAYCAVVEISVRGNSSSMNGIIT